MLDEALTSSVKINTHLRDILDDATDKWGVRMVRVEIQRIDPPSDVIQSMHHQMQAERTRRAVVTEAQGAREAAITRAEGEKQAVILAADGDAQAMERIADAEKYRHLAVAQGEAGAIKSVFDAMARGRPDPRRARAQVLRGARAGRRRPGDEDLPPERDGRALRCRRRARRAPAAGQTTRRPRRERSGAPPAPPVGAASDA